MTFCHFGCIWGEHPQTAAALPSAPQLLGVGALRESSGRGGRQRQPQRSPEEKGQWAPEGCCIVHTSPALFSQPLSRAELGTFSDPLLYSVMAALWPGDHACALRTLCVRMERLTGQWWLFLSNHRGCDGSEGAKVLCTAEFVEGGTRLFLLPCGQFWDKVYESRLASGSSLQASWRDGTLTWSQTVLLVCIEWHTYYDVQNKTLILIGFSWVLPTEWHRRKKKEGAGSFAVKWIFKVKFLSYSFTSSQWPLLERMRSEIQYWGQLYFLIIRFRWQLWDCNNIILPFKKFPVALTIRQIKDFFDYD